MPQGDKSSKAKQKSQARGIDRGNASKGSTGPAPDARAWTAINKLPGQGKRMAARRNLPSGPLGGSGRKSNVPRSS